jgi:ribosomal protein S18 acetylase RimI-like enzyme
MGESGDEIRVEPVGPDRWDDLVHLAGERGFTSCWCMWWRLTNREFQEQTGPEKRRQLQVVVEQDHQPGLLAYLADQPVGWAAVAPRTEYRRLARSTKLKPVDDEPVWSIPCFYIDRHHRGRGVASALLRGAVAHARARGAQVVEAYPIDTELPSSRSNADLYTGTLAMFERAGFQEVARRGGRPIVRLALV